jgi:putative nucleotidyltransferase with HDIG domain
VSSTLFAEDGPAARGLQAGWVGEAWLRDEVARRRECLAQAVRGLDADAATAVLLASAAARSADLHDHVRRVAQSAAALARALRLPAADVRTIRTAALLQDVGKVAMPRSLLDGNGPLSDDEVAVLQSHVSGGAEVLRTVPGLEAVADLVIASRERFDGCGYPARLAGATIPLGARIIAVADAYDALTSARMFDDPLSHDGANAELVRRAGSQFDPDVVRAWLDLTERARCC